MHVKKTEDGFEVFQFDAVGDGSDFNPTAKAIFGDRFDAFMALYSNDDAKKAARAKSILDYAEAHGLDISCDACLFQTFILRSILFSVSKKRLVAMAGPKKRTPKVFQPNMCHQEV